MIFYFCCSVLENWCFSWNLVLQFYIKSHQIWYNVVQPLLRLSLLCQNILRTAQLFCESCENECVWLHDYRFFLQSQHTDMVLIALFDSGGSTSDVWNISLTANDCSLHWCSISARAQVKFKKYFINQWYSLFSLDILAGALVTVWMLFLSHSIT